MTDGRTISNGFIRFLRLLSKISAARKRSSIARDGWTGRNAAFISSAKPVKAAPIRDQARASRSGRFTVLRQTVRKRLQAKLNEVKTELRRRMHHPIPEVGQWLRSVVDGHNRYYGVPMNDAALHLLRIERLLRVKSDAWHVGVCAVSPYHDTFGTLAGCFALRHRLCLSLMH